MKAWQDCAVFHLILMASLFWSGRAADTAGKTEPALARRCTGQLASFVKHSVAQRPGRGRVF